MKLVRYGAKGQEKPGIVDAQGRIRSLEGHVQDIAGEGLSAGSLQKLAGLGLDSLPLVEGSPRLGACVGKVGKMICIGLNYSDHAAESGMQVPPEPVIFMKATSAICGPNDDVEIPRKGEKTDWEVELGIVIGEPTKYVSESEALDHIAGYCIVNDVSERHFQAERSGQWTKGKSHDTFGPTGPWLVTKDEDPRAQRPRHVAGGGRAPLPERLDPDHGLQGAVPGQLPLAVHEPAAGRHHLHRHPARRGPGAEAPGVPQGRPGDAARHRRPGRAAPAHRPGVIQGQPPGIAGGWRRPSATEKNPVLTTILAAVDGSEHARRAATLAGDLAGRYGARLVIVHVMTSEPMPAELKDLAAAAAMPAGLAEAPAGELLSPADEAGMRLAVGERLLDEAMELARGQGADTVQTLLLRGDAATVILERVAQEDAHLVVMGAKGLGALKDLLLGSVSQKVSQLAPCGCLTVR